MVSLWTNLREHEVLTNVIYQGSLLHQAEGVWMLLAVDMNTCNCIEHAAVVAAPHSPSPCQQMSVVAKQHCRGCSFWKLWTEVCFVVVMDGVLFAVAPCHYCKGCKSPMQHMGWA